MKTVTCSCGYVASGETAGELLADVEAHIDAAHGSTPETVGQPASEARGAATPTMEATQ